MRRKIFRFKVEGPVIMKLLICLIVFTAGVVTEYGRVLALPASILDSKTLALQDSYAPLTRVARQMSKPPGMPELPPGMPKPPPGMPMALVQASSRDKREAKGGGAMPTRKG